MLFAHLLHTLRMLLAEPLLTPCKPLGMPMHSTSECCVYDLHPQSAICIAACNMTALICLHFAFWWPQWCNSTLKTLLWRKVTCPFQRACQAAGLMLNQAYMLHSPVPAVLMFENLVSCLTNSLIFVDLTHHPLCSTLKMHIHLFSDDAMLTWGLYLGMQAGV